ncbi:hypothetical protein [Sphingobacterium cellulitidis]
MKREQQAYWRFRVKTNVEVMRIAFGKWFRENLISVGTATGD